MLAGAAGLPILSAGGSSLRRVGIVGAGMAGVSLAWMLDGQREVVVIEARDSIGGNVQSVPVQLDGQNFIVDMGAQYFNPALYPTYVKLLSLLGLSADSHSFAASITEFAPGEQTPRFVSPVLPGRAWPLLALWNYAGIQAFAVAFSAAKKREEANASWALSLESWLSSLGLTQAQWEGMILPWAASLYSGDINQARGLSARAAMIFAAKALPDNPLQPVLYYVLNSGMIEVLQGMLAQCTTVQVLTGSPVTQVARDPESGFIISYGGGHTLHVDDLVFASSGPPTLSLLAGLPGTAALQSALQGIEFQPNRLALHTDPIYAPSDQNQWSFFNCEVQGNFAQASMWLRDVLTAPSPTTAAKLWKSWVTHRTSQPQQVLYQAQYQHMVPTTGSLLAQTLVRALQGAGGISIAGGYTRPYDSQETALLSAMDVARGFLIDSARMRALLS
jgi:predicted NAD/FAD-binding protein